MKTILHVSKYYYPDLGGIETVAMYLAEGMTEYQNIVICFSTDKKYHEDNIHGVKVYRVPVNFSFMSQDVAFSYRRILKNIIKQYIPGIIHVHCPNPFVYPLVMGCIDNNTKLILHWHSDILSKGWAYYMIKPFEERILQRADVIVSTSPNYIPHSAPLRKYQQKVKVAQNGLITSNFDLRPGDQERIRTIRQSFSNKPIVFFAGRHVPYKGIDCLINADTFIKSDCVILIAGKGPHDPYLHTLPHSSRVQFLGRLSDDDLRCYSHAADIFAFPSVTKAEAFGIALAEAMYCRSVPVTFHLEGSGVNWVSIDGVTGEEVSLRDIKGLASAIDKIISNDDLRKQYAEAAHQRIIDMFTTSQAVEAMRKIYVTI